jgi:hypothetical protein
MLIVLLIYRKQPMLEGNNSLSPKAPTSKPGLQTLVD